MNTTKQIATYARVSTSRQEEEQTIKTQVLVLKEFAEKNGYTILKEYKDEGWSGDILARPSLDELRNDAKKKTWEAVLIYDPDRLARRYSYQELVMDELKEAGIEVIFITVPAPKNSEDKILHGVRGLFAEYERAKIAERFRLGKLRKIKEGHILVNEAPYGYRYIRIQDGKPGYYEVNEEEARIVKKIFEWAAHERLSIRKIGKRLYDLRIKPRRNKRGVWDKSSISYMLRNPAYIGKAMWGRNMSVVPEKPKSLEKYRKMKKTSKRARPESEWIAVPVPAIIEKELFEKVRDKLKQNFSFARRNSKYEYLLTGKIFCECGKRMGGQGHLKRSDHIYRCSDRLYSFPLPPTCISKTVKVRIVDSLVWDKIAELMSSAELMTEQVTRLMSNRKDKAESSTTEIPGLEKEIERLSKQEDRYNKAYAAGLFTLDKLQEYVVPIRGKIASLQSEITNRQQKAKEQELTPTDNDIEQFANRSIQKLKGLNFESKRAIVLNVIDKVIASRELVQVYGCISINGDSILCLNGRDSQDTSRPLLVSDHARKSIQFTFKIQLNN